MIEVRLPAMLGGETLTIADAKTIGDLTRVLQLTRPEIAAHLDDTIFNFAVNDEMLLHDAAAQPLNDGDVVEVVPAISGG
jgi:sulfur carrier protein ThiS